MTINVKELYENNSWGWSDYQPMLDAFGKIAIQIDDHDYQGDSRLLYDENGKIGLLIFGWGSCSGCDALQACDSLEEVQQLCDELQKDIKWFDDKKQALEYFTNHDWQGDYLWYADETKEFIKKSIEYLSDAYPPTEKEVKQMPKTTNYDRIRNMSVEKLAEGITNLLTAHLNKYRNALGMNVVILTDEDKAEAIEEWKQWLESVPSRSLPRHY